MATRGNVWQRWLKIAEVIGTGQMIVLLSLVYWVFLLPLAVPFKLLADPLALRRPDRVRWVQRPAVPTDLESMKKQY